MTDAQEADTEKAPEETKSPFLTKPRIIAAGLALGGMILGSFVGMGVQMGVESTGLLGPSVEQLFAEQAANFDEVNAHLADLRNLSSDPEVARSLNELGSLLARQEQLQQQANSELAYLGTQVAEFKEQALTERGFAGGADLWLKNGESVSVGDARHVFGVTRIYKGVVDVNANGAKSRLSVGDTVDISSEATSCVVFFKQSAPRPDGRVGFDVSCG